MAAKKLVSNEREQDGKFALRLESNAAVMRDLMREEARRQRMEQLRKQNEEIAQMGIDPAEVFA